jgi:hypothetical protein
VAKLVEKYERQAKKYRNKQRAMFLPEDLDERRCNGFDLQENARFLERRTLKIDEQRKVNVPSPFEGVFIEEGEFRKSRNLGGKPLRSRQGIRNGVRPANENVTRVDTTVHRSISSSLRQHDGAT